MTSLPDVPSWLPAWQLGVIATVVVTAGAVWWLDRDREWGSRRRSRLLLGVPWGTVVTVLGVLSVYLFLQGGWDHWRAPVTIPFRSWSYAYPLGMVVAPFAHGGVGHLTGNLLATAVLAPLAEYAWGHFPEARGESTFSSYRTNPYVRAFVAFPAGVVLVGLATGLFSWGPVIGFSGVVYAFAGFALVRYPLGTVIAYAATDVVGVTYRALQDPVVERAARPIFVEPWWAGIAVQGHLLGLFLGLLAGALLLQRRERSLARLWVGALVIGTSLTLWALWWYRGNNEYVLHRGLGVMLVFVLAAGIALAVRAIAVGESDWTDAAGNVSPRLAGVLALLVPVLVVGAVAVPLNLSTVGDASVPGDGPGIEVRDYTVAYAENVTSGMTSVVNVSVLGETTQVPTSGVIVISEERSVWTTAVSRSRLAFTGTTRVRLGGLGWHETVTVTRRGWNAADGGTAYKVWLRSPDGTWHDAFRSEPAVADPTLAGMRVAVLPTPDGFALELQRNESAVARVGMPEQNDSATAEGITFVREGESVYATYDGTRVQVAGEETYR